MQTISSRNMDEAEGQRIFEGLRKEFCPPFEEGTLLAICSDYDLESPDELQTCVDSLYKLKAEMFKDDTTYFDPSGTFGFLTQDSGPCSESQSSQYDVSLDFLEGQSNTTGLSEPDTEDPSAKSQNLEGADPEAKTRWLTDMFPAIPRETIVYRLKTCNGNVTRTVDELLNAPFIPKSVDGFSADEHPTTGWRPKGKRSARRDGSYATTDPDCESPTEPLNPWTSKTDDKTASLPATHNHHAPTKVDIGRRYSPLDLAQDEVEQSTSASSWSQVRHLKTRDRTQEYHATGNTAMLQAGDLYRKANSHNLMGQAAGYKAEVGRANFLAAQESSSYAADCLVGSQSTSTMLDLHGVSVSDAVRISRDRVSTWWDKLGDAKYASGGGGPAREGYRVVTGVGRHSRDGAPRIGPAVTKMLVREGWRVTVNHGELLVTGRARRH